MRRHHNFTQNRWSDLARNVRSAEFVLVGMRRLEETFLQRKEPASRTFYTVKWVHHIKYTLCLTAFAECVAICTFSLAFGAYIPDLCIISLLTPSSLPQHSAIFLRSCCAVIHNSPFPFFVLCIQVPTSHVLKDLLNLTKTLL